MNLYSGHMQILANGMAAPAGYEELPRELLGDAEAELAGHQEVYVDLRKKGPLQAWAKKKRKEKIAAKSRRINRSR